jgi:preprotein translocase subunit SecE
VATKKTKRDKKEKEKSKVNPVVRWWRETLGELRKVTWPTPQEARRLTGIVLVVMVFMAILLGLLDLVFSGLVTLIMS